MPTRLDAEAHWIADRGPGWLETYRQSAHEPWRQPMVDALMGLGPLDPGETALDLGCNCGVLVPALRAAGVARVTGVDINHGAIKAARRDWPDHDWILGSIIDVLPHLKPHGVVVSASCLGSVTPADIGGVLKEVSRLATLAIVLQESVTTPRFPDEALTDCGVTEWRYDYSTRLAALGWSRCVRVWQNVSTTRPAAVQVFRRT